MTTRQSPPLKSSLASFLSELPLQETTRILATLSPAELASLETSWRYFWARPEQLAPGTPKSAIDRDDWSYWMQLAGRGFGKTRSGAEWTIETAKEHRGAHIALVAATSDDARKVMLGADMDSVEGHSGILRISPSDFMPVWKSSKRHVEWPNGTIGTVYSADQPDRLRGPQHHFAWVDEIAAWGKYGEAWSMLLFGLRLGQRPRACITTTPRPIKLVRDLLADPNTVVTRGTTYDNRKNLSAAWFAHIIQQYAGTRLGRQELEAEVLDDHPGALWNLGNIDELRVRKAPELVRIVVAVDPAVTAKKDSNETGIIAAGIGPCMCTGRPEMHGFVLGDASGLYSPSDWGREVVARYKHHQASRVVAEVNNGGDLVERNIRIVDRNIPYLGVHASRGKYIRAEPVAALYQQGRVHHVGAFPKLEDQLTTWDPESGEPSPDRLDALVWAFTDLMIDSTTVADMHLPDLTQANEWSEI